jgi:hypothetical protein
MSHDPGYPYRKIKKNNKYSNNFDLKLIPELEKEIIDILLEDKNYWESKNKINQGISKNNLLMKLSKKIKKIPEPIFSCVIENLINEQKILFYELDNVVRYFYFELIK